MGPFADSKLQQNTMVAAVRGRVVVGDLPHFMTTRRRRSRRERMRDSKREGADRQMNRDRETET